MSGMFPSTNGGGEEVMHSGVALKIRWLLAFTRGKKYRVKYLGIFPLGQLINWRHFLIVLYFCLTAWKVSGLKNKVIYHRNNRKTSFVPSNNASDFGGSVFLTKFSLNSLVYLLVKHLHGLLYHGNLGKCGVGSPADRGHRPGMGKAFL